MQQEDGAPENERTSEVTHLFAVVSPENFDMNENQEIVLKGFLDLNLMEAKDADGDPNDLWVTLESMGYNRGLELDQVSSQTFSSVANVYI